MNQGTGSKGDRTISGRRPLRRSLLLAEVGIPLLILVGAELGLRGYVATHPDTPMPRLFFSSVDTGKYLSFRRWVEGDRPLDVLLLGLSPMMRVDGRTLHGILREAGYETAIFNFAGPYHDVDYDLHLLEDIILRLSKPRVVIYGVTPVSILHEERAAPFEELEARLPAFAFHDGTLGSRLYSFLLMNVSLVAYREVIRDALIPGGTIAADPFAGPARATDQFGGIRLRPDRRPWTRLMEHEQRFRVEFAQRPHLITESKLFPRLEALARFCARHGMVLVLLNNAVHPLFLELLPGGQNDYTRFIERLRAVANRSEIRFFDPAAGHPADAKLFNDTHHHNSTGGAWITEQLARYLLDHQLLER